MGKVTVRESTPEDYKKLEGECIGMFVLLPRRKVTKRNSRNKTEGDRGKRD